MRREMSSLHFRRYLIYRHVERERERENEKRSHGKTIKKKVDTVMVRVILEERIPNGFRL